MGHSTGAFDQEEGVWKWLKQEILSGERWVDGDGAGLAEGQQEPNWGRNNDVLAAIKLPPSIILPRPGSY